MFSYLTDCCTNLQDGTSNSEIYENLRPMISVRILLIVTEQFRRCGPQESPGRHYQQAYSQAGIFRQIGPDWGSKSWKHSWHVIILITQDFLRAVLRAI